MFRKQTDPDPLPPDEEGHHRQFKEGTDKEHDEVVAVGGLHIQQWRYESRRMITSPRAR